MPFLREERYLRDSIESILGQTFEDFEFTIVSEVTSSGEAISLIESYRDGRISHIRKNKFPGVCDSINLGMREARGEYVALMNDDRRYLKGKLKDNLNARYVRLVPNLLGHKRREIEGETVDLAQIPDDIQVMTLKTTVRIDLWQLPNHQYSHRFDNCHFLGHLYKFCRRGQTHRGWCWSKTAPRQHWPTVDQILLERFAKTGPQIAV
jgi:glycosyltransferase involved in cell wall biosynthesis